MIRPRSHCSQSSGTPIIPPQPGHPAEKQDYILLGQKQEQAAQHSEDQDELQLFTLPLGQVAYPQEDGSYLVVINHPGEPEPMDLPPGAEVRYLWIVGLDLEKSPELLELLRKRDAIRPKLNQAEEKYAREVLKWGGKGAKPSSLIEADNQRKYYRGLLDDVEHQLEPYESLESRGMGINKTPELSRVPPFLEGVDNLSRAYRAALTTRTGGGLQGSFNPLEFVFVGVGLGITSSAIATGAKASANPRLFTYSRQPTFKGDIFKAGAAGRAWATKYGPKAAGGSDWAFGTGIKDTMLRMLRTGQIKPFVSVKELTGPAKDLFMKVRAIGPARGWKQLGGQYFTPRPGNIDLTTGTILTPMANHWIRFGTDAFVYYTADGAFLIGTGYAIYVTADQLMNGE